MTDLPERYEPKKSARAFMKWLVCVVLLLNLLVVALALISLHQSRLQYVERARVQTQNLTQALMYSMSGILENVNLALLSVSDEAEREALQGGIQSRSINAYMTRQHGRISELDSLRMADAQGRILYGTGVVAGSANSVADRDYFRQLRDEPGQALVISKPVLGRISGKWVVVIARRVNNLDGSFGGVVYGGIQLERIRSILSSIDVGPGGRISLRDIEMRTIVSQPAAKGPGGEVGRMPTSPEMLRRIAAGERSGTFYTQTSSDHSARFVSFRDLKKYPLYIVVSLAASDYLSPWWRDLIRMALLVALFVAVTLHLSRLVFLRWLREKQAEPDARVIISSGYNEQEVTGKFIGKGLAGFIQKPYRLVEVSRKLRQILSSAG